MGRYLLCGKRAAIPYEVEEADIRLYSIEELCYFIFYNLALLDDDFIDDRLMHFIRSELELKDMADKIERFYVSPSDMDATLMMIMHEAEYFSDLELHEFQNRLVQRRRLKGPERVRDKGMALMKKRRYQAAVRVLKPLVTGLKDGRLQAKFYLGVSETLANAYGRLCEFENAFDTLAGIYDQTRSERVLRKMYDTAVLSGMDLPEKYFGRIPDAVLYEWQQHYWNRESVYKSSIEDNTVMHLFLHDKEKIQEDLKQYVDTKKEEYRSMLE